MTDKPIKIVEVGPRDGLQNEPKTLSVEQRVALINWLSECELDEIEVGSFVSPKWVPQMANTDEVFLAINKVPDVRYSVLTPNMKGLEKALEVEAKAISIFTAASEAFNQKNINCTIDESFERFAPMMKLALEKDLRVRGYVSCITHCPYSGAVSPADVLNVTDRLLDIGCAEVSLGETIGRATADDTRRVLGVMVGKLPVEQLALHCHDTHGQALENIAVGLEYGITTFDAAIGGLGGCPYADGQAKGNVATEAVVEFLQSKGCSINVNQENLSHALDYLRSLGVLSQEQVEAL